MAKRDEKKSENEGVRSSARIGSTAKKDFTVVYRFLILQLSGLGPIARTMQLTIAVQILSS